MLKIINNIIFEHAAVFSRSEGMFVRGRALGSSRIMLFFLSETRKKAYFRVGPQSRWDALEDADFPVIWAVVQQKIRLGLPVLVVKGNLDILTQTGVASN